MQEWGYRVVVSYGSLAKRRHDCVASRTSREANGVSGRGRFLGRRGDLSSQLSESAAVR